MNNAVEKSTKDHDDDDYRSALQAEGGKNDIDIREGVLDNMAAVLDPAFRDLAVVPERSIYQVKLEESGFRLYLIELI